MIRINQLTKRYGRFTAVDGIDLAVPSGELFGFLGPNGAGKTTTFRMIAGILRPTSGTIEVGGIDINRRPLEAKARLGFIPDRPFVYDKLTGAEFLRFAAALYGQQGAVVERRIDELLELFELTRWKNELTASSACELRLQLLGVGAVAVDGVLDLAVGRTSAAWPSILVFHAAELGEGAAAALGAERPRRRRPRALA